MSLAIRFTTIGQWPGERKYVPIAKLGEED